MNQQPPRIPFFEMHSFADMVFGASDVDHQSPASSFGSFSDLDTLSPVTPTSTLPQSPRCSSEIDLGDIDMAQIPFLGFDVPELAYPVSKVPEDSSDFAPLSCSSTAIPRFSSWLAKTRGSPTKAKADKNDHEDASGREPTATSNGPLVVRKLKDIDSRPSDYFTRRLTPLAPLAPQSSAEGYAFLPSSTEKTPTAPPPAIVAPPNPFALGSPFRDRSARRSTSSSHGSSTPSKRPMPSIPPSTFKVKKARLSGGSDSSRDGVITTGPEAIATPSSSSTNGKRASSKPRSRPQPFPTRSARASWILASQYSTSFPRDYYLHPDFVSHYALGEELGAGAFGCVMSARKLSTGAEVAVKFILRSKVPPSGWVEDPLLGLVPTEVGVLRIVNHPGIVKFIQFLQDADYLYLVQELHGSPWVKGGKERSLSSISPLDVFMDPFDESLPSRLGPQNALFLEVPLESHITRPNMGRRPSHDLFECIEQHKRLSEEQARYIFAQVVDIICYLESLGICHRDIKDENLVIDSNYKVKLIDFGSAVIYDPRIAAPYHYQFYGTFGFASSEILQGLPYQAAPADIWAMGILLSFLVMSQSAFVDDAAAIEGSFAFLDKAGNVKVSGVSLECLDLICSCLRVNPEERFTIRQVRDHCWLRGAFSR